ncbi:MAG: hypothetical protein H6969_02135 [Gammaproteobacteria bacterium]|nr:hypothetical protein [Gammaproteobacteria bacterium]MCP5459131.1 hypothetical protein [Gammaproteobacteria bacterium]
MPIDPERLRKLLGQPLIFQGLPYQVLDVIEEGPALVLRDARARKTIQANQHGEPSRWVPHTVTVAVLNDRRDDWNPALADLPALLAALSEQP